MRYLIRALCGCLPLIVFAFIYFETRSKPSDNKDLTTDERILSDPYSDEEKLEQIKDAFKLYAKAFDNHYPNAKQIYGDSLMRSIRKKMGLPIHSCLSASNGFGRLTTIQRTDSSFRYFGSTTQFGDRGRVLAQWKTPQNKIRLLFGDLSHQDLSHDEYDNRQVNWDLIARQCVVRINNHEGSGTIVSPDGWIATANHVIKPKQTVVEIRFTDGRILTAEVINRSQRLDVALLKLLDQFEPIPYIEIERQVVSSGSTIRLIGFGGAKTEPNVRTCTTTHVVLDELLTTPLDGMGGDSGGPLLDESGHLVGILSRAAGPMHFCSTTSAAFCNIFPALKLSMQVTGR